VVTRDVAPYTIVGGNPAHKIRERFSNAIIEELLQIQWWHFHIEKITENIGAIVQGHIEPLRKLNRE
ncbi:chloramphenicol acetyltransferase, partial [Escherichia coli]|nr:chloramphenicol acetyltransferase [Escherichia coli]